jgi:hypothetical protein
MTAYSQFKKRRNFNLEFWSLPLNRLNARKAGSVE